MRISWSFASVYKSVLVLVFVFVSVFFEVVEAQWERSSSTTSCRRTKVAVLGAGVAGITAAQTLSENGVDDFIIIEYNANIGGRCTSTIFGKNGTGQPYNVELGANWIQGAGSNGGRENPIWSLVKKYDVKNHISNPDSISIYDATGPNDFSSVLDTFRSSFDIASAATLAEIGSRAQQSQSLQESLEHAGWHPDTAHKQATEWYTFDYEYAERPEFSSAKHTLENFNSTFNAFSPNINFVTDQRGFNSFIKGQASEFLSTEDQRLLLSTIVQNISYSDNSVEIRNTDGTCIVADYAITTFSLGVLQSGNVIFSPPLPSWKQKAIDGFSMGTFTKIFIQFPNDQIFWNKSQEFFMHVFNTTRGYYPIFQSLDHADFLPGSGILVATVVAEQAKVVEKQSDDITKGEIITVLRQMFGEDAVPDPIDFVVSRWNIPWSYGSFSNWPVHYTDKDHLDLRANVGRIWFAGEATSKEHWGYLHGAYFEGQRVGRLLANNIAPAQHGMRLSEDGGSWGELRKRRSKGYLEMLMLASRFLN